MAIYSMLCYGLWRILEKICFRFNVYILVKTRTGIKNVNVGRLYGNNEINYNPNDILTIAPEKLFLSVDYLKDRYTLLDTCILESPHYGLVEAINSGKDIKKTDYYKRFITGKLDGRHTLRVRNLSYFHDKNKKAKESIERGDYKPVQVYLWKNRYYICDGKHRAALCALLNKDIRCIQVPSVAEFTRESINNEIYRIMATGKDYSKHINYLTDEQK